MKRDKLGRKYMECEKCKRRLSRIEYRGKTKFICKYCQKKNRKTKYDSDIIQKFLKKGDDSRVLTFEVTVNNSDYHYIDGKPVQGLLKASKYFRARLHNLIEYKGYKLLCPYCKTEMVKKDGKWICYDCYHVEMQNINRLNEMFRKVRRYSYLCPKCLKEGTDVIMKITKLSGRYLCKRCNHLE